MDKKGGFASFPQAGAGGSNTHHILVVLWQDHHTQSIFHPVASQTRRREEGSREWRTGQQVQGPQSSLLQDEINLVLRYKDTV